MDIYILFPTAGKSKERPLEFADRRLAGTHFLELDVRHSYIMWANFATDSIPSCCLASNVIRHPSTSGFARLRHLPSYYYEIEPFNVFVSQAEMDGQYFRTLFCLKKRAALSDLLDELRRDTDRRR